MNKQLEIINMFIEARISHMNFEQSILAKSPKIVHRPNKRKQGVNSSSKFHRNNIIAESCKKPQNVNVSIRDIAGGKMILRGLKIYFAR